MKRIFFLMAAALMSAAMFAGLHAGELTECKLYFTNFQDWEAVSNGTAVSTQQVTTKYSNEELTFSFCETEIKPDGTNAKFTEDFITPGYAKADKKATPYIETSALKSITKVHYVHAATGGERGWGLQYRVAGESEWTTASSAYCKQAGTEVDVAINKENVQLRWYNLNASQNAYMTELAIYGMAEDDGQPMEYTITYFDQDGNRIGEKVQTELETLVFAFGETDLTIPDGYKFRGWYDGSKKRHEEGEAIEGDLRLNALVTKIEEAKEGLFYVYNLASPVFYPQDHELIDIEDDKATLHLDGKKVIIVLKANGEELFSQDEGSEFTETNIAGLQELALYFVKEFVPLDPSGYRIIPSGDAANLLLTLRTLKDGDKVYLPNGVYDLGETVLSPISKKNVSLIGQSMEGVIIKNAPDYRTESINNTATLYLTGENIYLQDLTIQNALDYYKTNNGRAVALWSKCSKVICKNVRLLSYQDTYYSNRVGGLHYFEDCEIHGTVDFICGDGSVYFKNNLLYCEKRGSEGGGNDVLTASNADASDRGYVFEGCTVKSECPSVSFGRAWNNKPQVAFLNTKFDYSAGNFALPSTRWTPALMNKDAWPVFGEFNTRDADASLLTPNSNVVTFVDEKNNNATQDIETVLSEENAAKFTIEYTLGSWAETAKKDAKQVRKNVMLEDGVLRWNPCDAGVYLVFIHSVPYCITTETSIDLNTIDMEKIRDLYELYYGRRDIEPTAEYYVRFANGRGGFGPAVYPWDMPEGLSNTGVSNSKTTKIVRDGQVVIVRDDKEYTVLGNELVR